MHITLRQFETLRVFAQTQSVTETAKLTHVTQPAVSQTLKELESQLGFPVYTRVGGKATLTREALHLLPHVENLMAELGAIQLRGAELRDMKAGAISIMCRPCMADQLLTNAIAEFRVNRPDVHFDLQLDTRGEIPRAVKEEAIDIGFDVLTADEPGMVIQPLIRTKMVCAMRKGTRLPQQKAITIEELRGETLILVNRNGSLTTQILEALDADRTRASVINTNQSSSALSLVQRGAGVALLQPIGLNLDLIDDLDIVPFEPEIDVTVGFIFSRRRPMSRLATKFIGQVTEGALQLAKVMATHGVEMEVLQ